MASQHQRLGIVVVDNYDMIRYDTIGEFNVLHTTTTTVLLLLLLLLLQQTTTFCL